MRAGHVRRRFSRPPPRDRIAEEIAAIAAHIERLELAALIGSTDAAGRLADMAEDHIGEARRQMARAALARLRARDIAY